MVSWLPRFSKGALARNWKMHSFLHTWSRAIARGAAGKVLRQKMKTKIQGALGDGFYYFERLCLGVFSRDLPSFSRLFSGATSGPSDHRTCTSQGMYEHGPHSHFPCLAHRVSPGQLAGRKLTH